MEEAARLETLNRYSKYDIEDEKAFDEITQLATYICATPMAAISFVEADRVWYQSPIGLPIHDTLREDAFCSHAILQRDVLVIEDAGADSRFALNPWVTGDPGVCFYAGAPLIASSGHIIGSLSVWDIVPRKVTQETVQALQNLAGQLVQHLENIRYMSDLEETIARMKHEDEQLKEQITQVHGYSRDLQVHAVRLESINSRLETMAKLDGMTGLKNHRAFQERLNAEFERAVRYSIPLSLLLLDVDNFKLFNDTYGHLAGDEVLKTVAQVLQECARGVDFVARYGGEEFVVILPHTEEVAALAIGERLRIAIEGVNWPLRLVTASMGISTLNNATGEGRDLIALADKALYYSKSAGRNLATHAKDVPEEAQLDAVA